MTVPDCRVTVSDRLPLGDRCRLSVALAAFIHKVPDHRILDPKARTIRSDAHAGVAGHHIIRFQLHEYLRPFRAQGRFGAFVAGQAYELGGGHPEQLQRQPVAIEEARRIVRIVRHHGHRRTPQIALVERPSGQAGEALLQQRQPLARTFPHGLFVVHTAGIALQPLAGKAAFDHQA